jgi:hypothetical protein
MLEAALHREGDGHGHRAPGARCWRSASFGRVVVYCHRNRVHGHRPGCRRRPRRATRRALRESRGSCNVYVQGNSATVSACNVYVHESRRRIPWPGRVASAVTVRAGPPALTSRTRAPRRPRNVLLRLRRINFSAPRTAVVPQIYPQIPLCKKKIFYHIKISVHI